MTRLRALGLCAFAVLLLAGCDSRTTTVTVARPVARASTVRAPVPGRPCTTDYYMQCAVQAPGQTPPQELKRRGAGVFGIDFAWGGPSGSVAEAFGAHFGISYLSGFSKDWSPALLASYAAEGLGRVFVWEQTAGQAQNGCTQGRADALAASNLASRLGYAGVPIYFAVDTDTSASRVDPFFRCAGQAIGKTRVGVYGGYYVVSGLWSAHLVSYVWQTVAWSYGNVSPHACLYQYRIEQSWHGYNVDYNLAFCSDYGQYRPAPPPPPDPLRRLWYSPGPFHSGRFGNVNERLTVVRYDGARKHPQRYVAYLIHLEHVLRFLAARDSWVAHHPKHNGRPSWGLYHRGWRYQQLIHRAQGKRLV